MKWKKWVPIGLCLVIFCLIIGIVILPEFMIDKVRFPASIVYWPGFQEVRKLVPQPDPSQFLIVEHELTDSAYHEVKPLDESQIKKMVNQLIPKDLASKSEQGKVILSSPNKKVMKDFQEYLQKELPEGWVISRSTSDVDVIVTGNLFQLTPPEKILNIPSGGEAITISPTSKEHWLNSAKKDGNELLPVPTRDFEENRNELSPTNQNGNEKSINQDEEPRRALFLYWITETNPNPKIVFGATANYKNPNISAASKDIVNNLTDKNLIDTEKSLKIAVINISEIPHLVTASILEEMVNAKTDLTFLDIRYAAKHETELKQILQSPNNQKVSLEDAAEKFSNSTGASAVLIISQPSEGHFYLELMDLPSLDILAIGRSDNRSEEQLQ